MEPEHKLVLAAVTAAGTATALCYLLTSEETRRTPPKLTSGGQFVVDAAAPPARKRGFFPWSKTAPAPKLTSGGRFLGEAVAGSGAGEPKEPKALAHKPAPAAPQQPEGELTREQVAQVLREIEATQETMRSRLKELSKALKPGVTFEETCKQVQAIQEEDPLEKRKISMEVFDRLLEKFQSDPDVQKGVARMMGTPGHGGVSAPQGAKTVPMKDLIAAQAFMLDEIEKLGAGSPSAAFDARTVTLATQALVGSRLEKRLGLTSEDVEGAVLSHHAQLATDQEFNTINVRMQAAMDKLLGVAR